MLDELDLSDSLLRKILWDALNKYSNIDLIEFCYDKDPILRTASAKKLQLRSGNDVFKAAIDFCGNEDQDMREIGCFILGQLGVPEKPYANESIILLRDLAADNSAEVRAAAIYAMGHLAVPSSLEAILKAVTDDDVGVRQSAAFALGAFEGEVAGNAIRILMDDSDSEVREWAEISFECINSRRF